MFNKKFNLLKEATEYGFMPYMETYILDGKKRPIVVIFPGGGYGMYLSVRQSVLLWHITQQDSMRQ